MKLKTKTWSRTSRVWPGALAGVALAGVACGGNELLQSDLGNTTGSDSSERTPLIQADGSVDSIIAGHWIGEAEDLFSPAGPDGQRPVYRFPSGSQQVRLDLSFGDPVQNISPPSVAGRISFGEGPIPEPTAGEVYPAGLSRTDGDLATIPPLEGFAYNLGEVRSGTGPANGALLVSYAATESYSDWCALQPARANASGTFDCITAVLPEDLPPTRSVCRVSETTKDPVSGITYGSRLRYDCSLGWLCQACQCSSKGCRNNFTGFVQLWLMRSGPDLLGTFVRAVFDYGDGQNYLPVGNVRFRRQD